MNPFGKEERMEKLSVELFTQLKCGCRFSNVSLEKVKTKGNKETCEIVKSWMDNLESMALNGYGLLILGTYRSGKTALSIVCAKEVLRWYGTAFFVCADDIVPAVIEKWICDEEEGVTWNEYMKDVDLLIIDDLGREKISEYSKSAIERIIRWRYDNVLMTIITSNMKVSELEELYGKGFMGVVKSCCRPILIKGDWSEGENKKLIETTDG